MSKNELSLKANLISLKAELVANQAQLIAFYDSSSKTERIDDFVIKLIKRRFLAI